MFPHKLALLSKALCINYLANFIIITAVFPNCPLLLTPSPKKKNFTIATYPILFHIHAEPPLPPRDIFRRPCNFRRNLRK